MRVLLADDHSILREGVKSVLNALDQNTVVDEASKGQDAIAMARANQYDLILLDISLPDINGLEVLQRIKNSGSSASVAFLSLHPEGQYASRAFSMGAVGYINKNASFDELKGALEKLMKGGKYVSSSYAEKIAFGDDPASLPHQKLSDRELQVMLHIAKGASLSEIADKLCIADKTVSTYRTRVMEKMHFKYNAEITIYAMKMGLIL